MPVNVLNESVVSMAEAARIIPTRPHISTLWRWYRRGCRGIRLETVILGGKRYTSHEAIQRFVEATTEAHDRGGAAPRRPIQESLKSRRATTSAAKAARQKLAKAGI